MMAIKKVIALILHCGLVESTMKIPEFSETSNCQKTY